MRIPAILSLLALTVPLCAQEAVTPTVVPKEPVFREQSIYIPYDKLWKVFEKEGRGVFVPYEEFNRLWTAARANLNARAEAPAPMASILKEVAGVLTVGTDVVEATATRRVSLVETPGDSLAASRGSTTALTPGSGMTISQRLTAEGGGWKARRLLPGFFS